MDPQAALERWRRAVRDNDREEAHDAALDLARWIRSGGFEPKWKSKAEREKVRSAARRAVQRVSSRALASMQFSTPGPGKTATLSAARKKLEGGRFTLGGMTFGPGVTPAEARDYVAAARVNTRREQAKHAVARGVLEQVPRGSRSTSTTPACSDLKVTVWEERDRLHIAIVDAATEQETVAEWWDDDARQMFEDGFFKSGRELRASVLEYAKDMGLCR